MIRIFQTLSILGVVAALASSVWWTRTRSRRSGRRRCGDLTPISRCALGEGLGCRLQQGPGREQAGARQLRRRVVRLVQAPRHHYLQGRPQGGSDTLPTESFSLTVDIARPHGPLSWLVLNTESEAPPTS